MGQPRGSNKAPLPIVVSVPHGGTVTPIEVLGLTCLDPKDLFDDSDSYTNQIYNFGNRVEYISIAEVARAFVDLNRERMDFPPQNPDGVVKTLTCYGKQIYQSTGGLDVSVAQTLLEKYYDPYHQSLRKSVDANRKLLFGIDCHSMAERAPMIAPDQKMTRPLFCIGTRKGQSFPLKWAEFFADELAKSLNIKYADVRIDSPFSGGWITRKYGLNPLPWVQLEMNRSLYLSEEYFNPEIREVRRDRIEFLNSKIFAALSGLVDRISSDG